jgi:DNA-binding GntR family transcriptional regulator
MPASEVDDLLAPPASRSLADDIAERLRAAILAGHFAPGERLGEEKLAQKMNVSRGPIREAFARLEREGLVVTRRNRGAFVAQLTVEDLDELDTLRRVLEPLALQRAVERADGTDFQAMQQLVDEIALHNQLGISEQVAADLDLRFHDLIYLAAKHRRLYDAWSTIRPQIHIVLLSRNVAHRDFRDMVVEGHQQLLDAMRDRDAVLAIAILEDHLAGSYQRVARSYERRDRGDPATLDDADQKEEA